MRAAVPRAPAELQEQVLDQRRPGGPRRLGQGGRVHVDAHLSGPAVAMGAQAHRSVRVRQRAGEHLRRHRDRGLAVPLVSSGLQDLTDPCASRRPGLRWRSVEEESSHSASPGTREGPHHSVGTSWPATRPLERKALGCFVACSATFTVLWTVVILAAEEGIPVFGALRGWQKIKTPMRSGDKRPRLGSPARWCRGGYYRVSLARISGT